MGGNKYKQFQRQVKQRKTLERKQKKEREEDELKQQQNIVFSKKIDIRYFLISITSFKIWKEKDDR